MSSYVAGRAELLIVKKGRPAPQVVEPNVSRSKTFLKRR